MSRSSRREDARSAGSWRGHAAVPRRDDVARVACRSSRAQTEPIAAIVALLAVGAGLALYAGAATEASPEPTRSAAEPVLERLAATALSDGVVEPSAVPDPESLARGGQHVRVTLLSDGAERQYGPSAPADADRASRPVSVRLRPGDVRPGRIVVEVWS